jgi:hypothetical protein
MSTLLSSLFLSDFPTETFYALLICPMNNAYPILLTLPELANVIIFEEYKK